MKSLLKKIAVFGLAAVTSAGLLAGSSFADEAKTVYRTVDEIKADGTINIGVFSDKSPFGYVDEYGEYQGYDVYFAERIAQDLGVDINYVSTEAASRIEYLQTGKVDIILANFTVTEERAEEVDFALPYMNVALGVVSHDDHVIKDLSEIAEDEQVIVISGTTAETYLVKNNPEIKLQKFDTYASAKEAFENGTGVAWANDNTEVIAFAIDNEGYTVGIDELGNADTIAPAVSKGNESLLTWLNDEIKALGEEQFFHADYEATLADTYGLDYEDTLVVEGGVVGGAQAEDAKAEDADAEDVEAIEEAVADAASVALADEAAEALEEGAVEVSAEPKGTITVAASPTPHAEILEQAAPILEKMGWTLDVIEFEDYIQPNLVVDSGEIDANYFQHIPFLENFNEENGTSLVNAGGIHYEPFGIYPGKKSSLDELEKGDTIAIPNDTTNEARALLLLQDNGLITLKEDAGLTATVLDIVDNPLDLEILELEAAQVSRVVNEVAMIVLNGNYALEAGFSVAKDSIVCESSDSEAARTYVNVIAVREDNEESEAVQALVDVLKSDEIKDFINATYDGAVVPFED